MAQQNPSELPMAGELAATVKGPVSIDTIAPDDRLEGAWRKADLERRVRCEWQAELN